MEHFGEFIDYDEGRDEPRQPFFAEALPCESCGAPCEERKPATWDPELLVGPCCELDLSQIPDLPNCESLNRQVARCRSIQEVSLAMHLHLAECPVCQSRRQETRIAA